MRMGIFVSRNFGAFFITTPWDRSVVDISISRWLVCYVGTDRAVWTVCVPWNLSIWKTTMVTVREHVTSGEIWMNLGNYATSMARQFLPNVVSMVAEFFVLFLAEIGLFLHLITAARNTVGNIAPAQSHAEVGGDQTQLTATAGLKIWF